MGTNSSASTRKQPFSVLGKISLCTALELSQSIMCGADAVASAADAQLSSHEPICSPAALCCQQGSAPHSHGACRRAPPSLKPTEHLSRRGYNLFLAPPLDFCMIHQPADSQQLAHLLEH